MKNVFSKDCDLIDRLISLSLEERRISVEIIDLLYEIEKRKAYSDLGHGSLFSFCVKELKYSESQAQIRIQTMYATKENPEIKEKIEAGKLSLTTVTQLQKHIRTQEKKRGKQVTVEEKRKQGEKVESEHVQESIQEPASYGITEINTESPRQKNKKPNTRSRHIPARIRREIFTRDGKKCRNCGTGFKLELDHRVPFGKNGTHEVVNLRVLCKTCNLREGIRVYGPEKMRR